MLKNSEPHTEPVATIEANAASAQPRNDVRRDDSAWSQTRRIISARVRTLSDRLLHRLTKRTLRIGISARIFHPESGAKGLRSKTLQYLEESIAQWVMTRDVMVFMIPTVNTSSILHPSNIRLRDYAKHLDGLVLQGGADVCPQTYAEAATRPEWSGDRARDMQACGIVGEIDGLDHKLALAGVSQ